MNQKKFIFITITVIIMIVTILVVVILLPEKKPQSHTEQAKSYTVTFRDFDGTVLKTDIVKAGEDASAPDEPQREGYTFVGWNRDFYSIDKDTIIIAEYLRITSTAFKVDTVTIADNNKKVNVKVCVTDNPGILGMVLSVNYDEEAFKLIDCQNGMALSALAFQEPSRLISGCNFVWYGSEVGEVVDGEMLILTFEIANDRAPGIYPIIISWGDNAIYDINSDMLNPSITQGAIVID